MGVMMDDFAQQNLIISSPAMERNLTEASRNFSIWKDFKVLNGTSEQSNFKKSAKQENA